MTLRWTQAAMETVAQEERAELGVGVMEALDPYALCRAHGIEVVQLDELSAFGCPLESVQHFHTTSSAWSAALIPIGNARLIIENEAHGASRRRSNIAHEMSHHLLEHDFTQVLLGEDHRLLVDPKTEKEARYLSGELLIPSAACKRMAFRDWTNDQVAERFAVSAQFAQMRMHGFRVMAARARAKQDRASRTPS